MNHSHKVVLMLLLQVYGPGMAANLVPSSPTTAAGSPVTFSVALPVLPASVAYTYTLDKGDGLPVSGCAALGTTSSGGYVAATALSGVSAAYTTPGLKSVVLRVYNAATCPVGGTPSAAASPEAVGTANIMVRATVAWCLHSVCCRLSR